MNMNSAPYKVETILELERAFASQNVLRPLRLRRREAGTRVDYEARSVFPDGRARVHFEIEKFVGGGFAGQVYKVKLLSLDVLEGRTDGLLVGRPYALKIFIPPSEMSRRIRGLFYGLAFQAPFSLQVLAAAGRSQALWQKFIRRAARVEFGREDAVVDVLATVLDSRLGSYGEVSEWVEGRMWRFEVDDDLDARRAWKPGRPDEGVGSPEYRTKLEFMGRLVRLMRGIGASELARQYEWWSLKSQPNALKRTSTDPDPKRGLVAVDFRAGMALLPFLPQCPADVKLIVRGLARGRLVQFDKGDLGRLGAYVEGRGPDFAHLRPALGDLGREDRAYRDSLVDVTYHHLRLFGRKLRRAVMNGFRESWRVRQVTDDRTSARLERSGLLSLLFLLLPFLSLAAPLLFVFAWPGRTWWKYPAWLLPLVLAPVLRRFWGRADLRRHYGKMLVSPGYFLRAGRARVAEAQIRWLRAGRVSEDRALKLSGAPWRYYLHLPFSLLPPGLHRLLTDRAFFKERLALVFVRPFRLFFNAEEREKWLRDMVDQGLRNGLLGEAEAARIKDQLKEPYIQKYLKSLAVHVATLFVSETVFLATAIVYVLLHPELSWSQATLRAGVIIGALNLLPISPGSLVRGFYVVGLMVKERNFKDYNIAFGVSFLKMVGYLAFPIQMAYRYPELARFMAGHWATGAVHRVPIFGEKGAWLEHFVFDAFYNFPLTLRRRMKRRAEARKGLRPRAWHVPFVALAAAAALGLVEYVFFKRTGRIPSFGDVWWLAAWVPVAAAWVSTRLAGGAASGKRIGQAMLAGAAAGALWVGLGAVWPLVLPGVPAFASGKIAPLVMSAAVRAILFGLLAAAGGFLAETRK